MTLVETITVGSGGAASMEFTGIPQDGVDLVVLLSARGDATAFSRLEVNSDTTNYAEIRVRNNNGGVSSQAFTGFGPLGVSNDPAYTANTFGNTSFYIANYAGSTSKSISVDGTGENNATSIQQILQANAYTQNTAVSSVTLTPTSGNFVEHSTASLYSIS